MSQSSQEVLSLLLQEKVARCQESLTQIGGLGEAPLKRGQLGKTGVEGHSRQQPFRGRERGHGQGRA